ncbi:DUF4238 domain-containing protein [Aliivibrio kagoshimensis]|uniref:DUF4238 domain-containing protein n=1 Tax=Aliivibrio kagoshimensis TaxID=2910230 RepID=UPI003D0D1E09
MTIKTSELKRNNHYIWKHYLSKWCYDSKNVFFSSEHGKVSSVPFASKNSQCHFYKAKSLTLDQLDFIMDLSKQSIPELHQIHLDRLEPFIEMQELCKVLGENKPEKVEKEFEHFATNTMEDMHTRVENDFRPILDALVEGKFDVLESRDNRNLLITCIFIAQQYMRTKNLKDSMILLTNMKNINFDNKLIDDCWWFVSYLLGMNVSFDLYSTLHERNVAFLVNNTASTFITGDQPVINIHPSQNEDLFISAVGADIYYPLSPKFALVIAESATFGTGRVEVTDEQVDTLNTLMAKRSHTHFFSDQKAQIQKYKKFKGKCHNVLSTFIED